MGGTLLGVHIVALVRTVLEHIVLLHKVLVHTSFAHFPSFAVDMVYILLLPQALEGRVN